MRWCIKDPSCIHPQPPPKMHLLTILASLLLSLFPLSLATVPNSPRFDLTKPSYDLSRHKTFHDSTVQQSFAFDNTNRRLFVAQRLNNADDSSLGHLCIT
ncbi:hypothetical protein B0T21DRAFT_407686 [Apiosordaria backusii]|uniref:Uncharacterized protein n=1 Tax=Apiosordaria backusii TaxID=314023 RepID=A0AA40K3K7_9PEZI|nr:hypothetical protein B0T21DRAFT_407686 [Apiosordaria backusii]